MNKKKPSLFLSLFPLLSMVLLLVVGYGYFKYKVEAMLLISAFIAGGCALLLGYTWGDMQEAIVEKIGKIMPAVLILWSVGALVGAWMFSGTIPMMIYYGVQIISAKYLLVSAFIITALVSVVTGTSWGSVGTVGVAIMGISEGLDVSLPATAGAVVAGSYFGDKMSPLSDTTNLAPIAAGSQLYEHISHMFYTTIPPTIVGLFIYFFVGLNSYGDVTVPDKVTTMLEQLDFLFHWHWVLLLPVIFILIASVMKLPATPIMLLTAFISVFIGLMFQDFNLKNGFVSMFSGFKVSMSSSKESIIWEVTRLINRGGISAMLSTTVLVIISTAFAGIISKAGMLEVIISSLLKKVENAFTLVVSTIIACFTIAFTTGSSYLTILIPGELFRRSYIKKGLHPKNLSRTLEDSGTVLVPLIPWSASGAYMMATLGVSAFDYFPWAILNYGGIITALVLAATGFGISKLSKEEQKKLEMEE